MIERLGPLPRGLDKNAHLILDLFLAHILAESTWPNGPIDQFLIAPAHSTHQPLFCDWQHLTHGLPLAVRGESVLRYCHRCRHS